MPDLLKRITWPRDVLLDPTWHSWSCPNNHITNIGFKGHAELYMDIVRYIFDQNYTIDRVHFIKMGDCIYVRFKEDRDYMLFVLKFGSSYE